MNKKTPNQTFNLSALCQDLELKISEQNLSFEELWLEIKDSNSSGLVSRLQVRQLTNNPKQFLEFVKSVRFLKTTRNPFLLQLKECHLSQQLFILEFEGIDLNLSDLLRKNPRDWSPSQIKLLFYQVVRAMAYFHENGIANMSVSPRNIYFDNKCNVRFGGFDRIQFRNLKLEFDSNSKQDYYVAPETILNNCYNPENFFAGDIWGLGCVLFEMMEGTQVLNYKRSFKDLVQWQFRLLGKPAAGQLGFVRNKHAREWAQHLPEYPGKRASEYLCPDRWGTLACDLLDKMLCVDPAQRLNITEIMRHPFFKELYDASHERMVSDKVGKLRYGLSKISKSGLKQLKSILISEI